MRSLHQSFGANPIETSAIRRKREQAAAKEAGRELKARNTELIAVNQRSQALIDLAPSGILVVDRGGTMTAVNAMETLGQKRAIATMCIGVGQGIAMIVERV